MQSNNSSMVSEIPNPVSARRAAAPAVVFLQHFRPGSRQDRPWTSTLLAASLAVFSPTTHARAGLRDSNRFDRCCAPAAGRLDFKL